MIFMEGKRGMAYKEENAERMRNDAENSEKVNKLYEKNYSGYWKRKRAFDIVCSLIGMILVSPLFWLIALCVYIDDPHGSPIYKQKRYGRHCEPFYMYKFRTMVVGAEKMRVDLQKDNEKNGPVFKMKNDPRVTRVGRILRKTGLDEIPQLLNVLKGDMSFVGPRPPLPEEVAQYSDYEKLRLMVTPGITCIWQIQPERDDISFEDWVDMDIDYIGSRTIRQDIKLIFKTIYTVLKGTGH